MVHWPLHKQTSPVRGNKKLFDIVDTILLQPTPYAKLSAKSSRKGSLSYVLLHGVMYSSRFHVPCARAVSHVSSS